MLACLVARLLCLFASLFLQDHARASGSGPADLFLGPVTRNPFYSTRYAIPQNVFWVSLSLSILEIP